MKIEIINDNEVNIIFMISDKTPEFNLPKLNGNDLLIESKASLKKLTNSEINSLFLNNNENLKIYLFPLDIDGDYFKNDKSKEVCYLLEKFIDNNDIVDLGYLDINNLDYIFSIHEYSRSFKHYLNETFEIIEKQQIINKNVLIQKFNSLIEYLKKYEILDEITLEFPEPNELEEITISSNITIPDSIDDKINIDKTIDINFDNINNNFDSLYLRYEELKKKIDKLHCNFLIKFSCFDAITTEQLLINSLMINKKQNDQASWENINPSSFYYRYENGVYQYYLNIVLLKNATIKILKDYYNEMEVKIESRFSIDDEFIEIDLGRLPLVKNKSHAYVLTWSSQPSDLDTHMYVFDENFIQLDHISFQQHSGYNSTVSLDVDDTSSYGPETLTITKFNNNAYYLYTIHNYSDQGDIGRWNYDNLTKINIIENNKLYTIQPRAIEYDGSWWDVFVIHNGKIYIVNTLISNNNRSSWCDVSFSKNEASNIIKNYIRSSTNIIDIKRN